jgi:hypothetical protein
MLMVLSAALLLNLLDNFIGRLLTQRMLKMEMPEILLNQTITG